MFEKIGVKIGDKVRISKEGEVYEGILMPKSEFSDEKSIVLKLSSGYNIGVNYGKGVKIEKLEGHRKVGFESKEIELKHTAGKPTISILSTGGTVASRVDYETGGVYASYKASDLIKIVPELEEITNINSKFLFSLMSEDVTVEHWKKMAREIAKEANSKSDGIVVTHGTDMMHFSTAAMSFMLKNLNKPVVFTGAQRSTDRGSSDGFMNLICASLFAAKSDVAEVCLVMHGSINDDYCLAHRGTKVRKLHTSRRDAFKSVNDEPIARIFSSGKIEILNRNYKHKNDEKVEVDDKFEERVALIKTYPNMGPEIFDFYIEKGYGGIVIEGTGLGHVPTTVEKFSLIPKIKEASERGMAVCITSQCLFGRVHPFVYANLRKAYEAGAIYCEDMLPEVAYVKLMHVLGHTKEREKVKELMLTNMAGEINSRGLVFE
jgi:glutamyl-tRNA(Gln) amidotransferase subunit D